MADLIAQGPEVWHRWRRHLPRGNSFEVGRSSGPWAVPWDSQVSRRHVVLEWTGEQLDVQRLPHAANPIFHQGSEQDAFSLEPGEHFVIGQTTFAVTDEYVQVARDVPSPVTEQTFSAGFLQNVRFRNADQRIDVMNRLPDVIRGAADDDELLVRLVNVLLEALPLASTAAVVATAGDGAPPVRVLQWDRRRLSGSGFRPSERLIREAIKTGRSVVHVWNSESADEAAFTQQDNLDWAFCTPVAQREDEHWGLYVAGRSANEPASRHTFEPEDLQDELKFTELVATVVSSLRQLRHLERNQAGLRQFFSPVVLDALAGRDPDEVLSPRETDVCVLFCDLRGFSRRSERLADELLVLLERVSRALGVMTRAILDQGGVIGDFHGDAAMGFWGWPLDQPDAVERACRAAMAIRQAFREAAERPQDPLADFRMGIGIAAGRAVAGKLGSVDQVKVTVFGPVVNLAARLESMTKILRAPVLMDEQAAARVRQLDPEDMRVRRVARVRPEGLEKPVEVSELLPPERDGSILENADIEAYERALDALNAGDWQSAFEYLHQVPATDRVKDFLTVFIAQHNRTPPDGWDGSVPLPGRST